MAKISGEEDESYWQCRFVVGRLLSWGDSLATSRSSNRRFHRNGKARKPCTPERTRTNTILKGNFSKCFKVCSEPRCNALSYIISKTISLLFISSFIDSPIPPQSTHFGLPSTLDARRTLQHTSHERRVTMVSTLHNSNSVPSRRAGSNDGNDIP